MAAKPAISVELVYEQKGEGEESNATFRDWKIRVNDCVANIRTIEQLEFLKHDLEHPDEYNGHMWITPKAFTTTYRLKRDKLILQSDIGDMEMPFPKEAQQQMLAIIKGLIKKRDSILFGSMGSITTTAADKEKEEQRFLP